MASVPKKVAERLTAGIKRYQPILAAAKSRDVGEADTVTIIKDMLADVFGYDKYLEVTSEYSIRGTYCDLGIKIDGTLQTLIEVKSIAQQRIANPSFHLFISLPNKCLRESNRRLGQSWDNCSSFW